MEKIREFKGTYILKTYRNDNQLTIFGLLDMLEASEMEVKSVYVEEDVELDLKSVENDYTVENFRKNYERIQKYGADMTFKVRGTFNGIPITINYDEKLQDILVLVSRDPKIELGDIIKERKLGM